MLKKLVMALSLILAIGFMWGQGSESFENHPLTGTTYVDGSYAGDNGVTWNYIQVAPEQTYPITNKGLILRRLGSNSKVYSSTVSGGIGSFTCQLRKAFTGAGDRQAALYVNNNFVANSVIFGSVTGADATIIDFTVANINVAGDIVIEIRNIQGEGTTNRQFTIDNISWTGYTAGGPVITATGTLNAFAAYTGTPSASQSYTLTGSNLTEGIVVTPPAGFAISTDNTTFYTSAQTLAYDYNGPVYVHLTGAAAGSFSGNITHTSAGATQVDKAVTGTVTDPAPIIHVTGTLNAFGTEVGSPSTAQTYTLYGEFLTTDISLVAPAGFEISTDAGASYGSTGSVASNFNGLIYVRLTGTTAGTYSGNIAHTSTGATQVDLAVSGVVTEPAVPTLFMEENFAYTPGTTVASNGWSPHGAPGTASPLVDATNFSYTNYPPNLGGSARTTGVTGEDISKGFTEQTSGDVYAAFLLNITGVPTAIQDYFFHLGDATVPTGGTTYFRGRLFAQKDANDALRFGISKASANTTVIQWTGGPFTGGTFDYALNTTYMMVLKYKMVAGAANDEVSLFINPTDTVNEPAATLSIGTADTASDPPNIGSVAIRQSANTPAAYYDGIRIANTWAKLWAVAATPVIVATGVPDPVYNIVGNPSEEVSSYHLSGTDLMGPINIVAPTHFEVSTSELTGYASTLQVPYNFDGTIWVRMNSSEVGEHSGDITHNSVGAQEVLVRAEGETFPAEVTWNVTGTLTPFTHEVGTPSTSQSYTLSATNATGNISVSVGTPFELSITNADPWTASLDLASSFNGLIYVRMNADTAGDYTGTIVHTTANATNLDVAVSGTATPPAGNYATDLFFSEYLEGLSNNKALEIFNGTGAPVDLGSYKVYLYSNGSPTQGNTLTFTAGTMLAHNDVYVIANAGANAAIQAVADVTSTVTYFNGDDALALIKVVDGNDTYVDIFGVIDQDPGTQWTADGGYSTLDRTLVRKPTVTGGVTVNPVNNGDGITTDFVTLATEWDVYPVDTISYLGAHTFTPGAQVAEAPVLDPAGGIYSSTVNVTMSSTTPGATIYYTTDGSIPSDTNGFNYAVTGPLAVSATTTVKAITYAAGYTPSSVTTATYVFPTLVPNIAALRAQPTGTTMYRLTGEAVLTFQQTTRHQKYIQDATAAIVIDDPTGIIATAYNLYDGITGITGTLNAYNNLLQFTPVADPGAATSTGNVIVPEVRTFASLTTDDQAKLIKVLNVTLDTTTGNFAATAENINATDPTATLVMRTFPATDYSGTPIPADAINLTCLVGQYLASMQVSPRFLADFEAVASLPRPVATITVNENGDYVLTWDAVPGATSYRIEVSEDPFNEASWTTLITTTSTTYTWPATEPKKFFRIIAVQ